MQYLSANSCAKLFDIDVATWYKWVKNDPTAPKPVVTAPKYTRWAEDDVLAYQDLTRQENRTGNVKKKEAA